MRITGGVLTLDRGSILNDAISSAAAIDADKMQHCYKPGTSTSITFDLKKNGTTMLSAVETITHGDSDRSVQTPTLSVTTFAADDVISIAMAVSSSTGAQGPYAWIELEENTAP